MQRLPGYRLGRRIHDGADSAVYRAQRLADNAPVVIKLSQTASVSARQLTRYQNEYELLRSLSLDGVVQAYEFIRHDGRVGLVLEALPGCSLKQWLAGDAGALRERVRIALRLTDILGSVHAANVIHKDVNSHNVVYDADSGQCKLIDFGLATQLRSVDNEFMAPCALEGTLAYMAPEQTGRINRATDYRADLYSLGVTLYELFTGCLPTAATDPIEIVHFHIAGSATPPCELDRRVPKALSDIVMKLLHKAPEARYQSAAGIAADLGACLDALDAGRPCEQFTLGADDISDRFELPQRLYGRDSEIATLLESFERSANGEVGTVLLSGPAGIGKTALVHEVHRPITDKRGYFAAGKFDQLQQDAPFSAVVAALKDLVEQLLTESVESVAAWRTAIRSAVGAEGRVLTDAIPSLEPIVGDQQPVPELEPHEAQERFHRVFRSLIQVFATPQHPLVLFFDDMQWADRASLNLITSILTAPSTKSLLLIQSYRDNEVAPAHAFLLEVQKQRQCGVRIESIALDALRLDDVCQFVAEALRENASSVASLAGKIYAKTAGNPFFLRQFLLMLHAEKLIRFDRRSNRFRYDTKAVDAAAITENVAELLTAKLDKLPPACRRALQLAAAIGNRFDLPTLALIGECTPADTARQLQAAIWDGLIVPLSRLENADPSAPGSPLVFRQFRFLHDRVQQAAYASLPADERMRLHLTIGRALLARPGTAGPQWFDAVNHMNLGHGLIDDPAERLKLAQLNLEAGAKARHSVAYELAVRNFRHAVELLGGEAWDERYELALDAHMKLAESLCVTADYHGAFAVIDAAAEHAASTGDRCKLLTLKVHAHLGVDQMPQALACGRRAAGLFGVDLPEEPERIEQMLQVEIEQILAETARRGIESLLELPLMTDPEQTALMALLTHCLPAAYQTDQELFALICCKMVLASLEHGNCPLSARAYGSFAALLSSALGRYREAYRFAKLAVDLCYRLDDPSVLPAAYFLWAMFASHWNEPIDESIEQFRKSVELGLQTGDHQHTAYSAARRITHLHFKGEPLAELRQQAEQCLALLRRIGDVANVELLEPRIRLIDWLRGEGTRGPTLDGDGFSERQCERNIRARGNQSILSHLHVLRLMHRYLSGDCDAALRYAEESEKLLQYSAGFVTRVEHNFYCSLSLAAAWYGAGAERRAEYERRLAANQEQLRIWADLCPHNFRAMHSLVEAERDRLRGATEEAMLGYDRAIADATEFGFTHIEALASELAARFWLQVGKEEFARLYLDKAVNAYAVWGAAGKAEDLQRSFNPDRRGLRRIGAGSGSTTAGGAERSDSLELITLLKASQVISGEIVLERLLPTLMGIIVENAGADYGALILESDGEFSVQATRAVGAGKTTILGAEPLRASAAVSRGVANYVIRAKEHVVLADPARRGKYQNDPYIRRRRPKSVLCTPVLHGGRLTAVIYLENSQVAGAFTANRLEALEILGAQIAVSIQNAKLYARQRQHASEIAGANEALTKEVAERRRAETELSVYKDRLEELVAQRTEQLEKAQSKLAAANDRLKEEVAGREQALRRLAESHEQIRALAYEDGLTGLPNRRLLNEHLEKVLARARRKGTAFALLFLDLDNFKLINDTLGHQTADGLLAELAGVLENLVRSEDVLALYMEDDLDLEATVTLEPITDSVLSRMGGDEFIILLPDIKDRFAAGSVAHRILKRLERPLLLQDKELFVNASIGIATYPEDGQTSESLIRNADAAMYHAKQHGKAAYQYYSEEMNAASVERLTLEAGLRRALDDGHLELYYQPQIEIASRRIVAAEVLLRWNHPERGHISPDVFVPIAEDTGLILPIGEWTLSEVCRQAAEWHREGLPPIPVAINVSGVQFRRQNLYEMVRHALQSHALDPALLSIEITETAIISALGRAVELMQQLKALGVGISLDDFGTGYSSLNYLKSFPINTLKIDRTFTSELPTDERTASITAAIISMSRILGLRVVAEGVETAEQFDLLKALGCHAVQGYYFSAALPAAEFRKLLAGTACEAASRELLDSASM